MDTDLCPQSGFSAGWSIPPIKKIGPIAPLWCGMNGPQMEALLAGRLEILIFRRAGTWVTAEQTIEIAQFVQQVLL